MAPSTKVPLSSEKFNPFLEAGGVTTLSASGTPSSTWGDFWRTSESTMTPLGEWGNFFWTLSTQEFSSWTLLGEKGLEIIAAQVFWKLQVQLGFSSLIIPRA